MRVSYEVFVKYQSLYNYICEDVMDVILFEFLGTDEIEDDFEDVDYDFDYVVIPKREYIQLRISFPEHLYNILYT